MAYPSWVAPQAMDPFGGFKGGFEIGSNLAGQQANRQAFARWDDETRQGQFVQPQPLGFLGSVGVSTPPPQVPSNGALQPTFDAVQGATVPELQNGLESYLANTRQAESGGNDAARNPNSSATGRYQFIDSTWQGLMNQYPQLGLTPEGRTDPAQQERAMRQFTADNARALQAAGIGVNPGSLYAAHFLGAGGASNVLGLADNTPMVTAVSPEVISANPFLRNMTVGDFRAWSSEKGGGSNGGYRAPVANEAGTGYIRGGSMPSSETLRAMFASPALRETAIQYLQAANAGAPLPDYDFTTINGQLVRTNATTGDFEVLGDFNSSSPAARPMTAEERRTWGIPENDIRPYMIDADGTPKLLGGSGQTINVSTGDAGAGEFWNTLGGAVTGRYTGLIEAGNNAARTLGQLDQLETLLANTPQGFGAAATQFAGNFGIDLGDAEGVQAASALINQMVPAQRPPGSGPMSDADLELFKQSVPRLINQPGGNQMIIDTMRAINTYDLQAARIVEDFTLRGQRAQTPEEADQLRSEMQAALNALQNPLENFQQRIQPYLREESQGGGGHPVVTNQQEYDAIPSGSQYLDADGNLRIKG